MAGGGLGRKQVLKLMAQKRIPRKMILFVEGTDDTSNGDLRRGIYKLLKLDELPKKPRIVMGGNKPETIKKFRNSRFDALCFLLIDLDAPESDRKKQLTSNDLEEHDTQVFFMVQEMEAWFLSQPAILDKYYGDSSISKNAPKRPPQELTDPKGDLRALTKKTRKGPYHEVAHGADLLALLDLNQLMKDFSDVAGLARAILATTS